MSLPYEKQAEEVAEVIFQRAISRIETWGKRGLPLPKSLEEYRTMLNTKLFTFSTDEEFESAIKRIL